MNTAIDVKDNWYEDFFQGINCELWEKAMPVDWTSQEVDFVINELGVQPGQKILDIPCGFGRHSIELTKQGFDVTGVDISSTFLKSLNEKITAENLSIQTIEANILDMQLDEKFSGAICLGNSFGYFDFDKMNVFIKKVSASLITGARFIINSGMIAESILPNFSTYAKNKTYTVENITMDVTNTYYPEDGYMTSELLYTKEGTTETHAYKHYVFTLGEIKRLLKQHSITLIATYSDVTKTTYNIGDQQVYIVGRKD
jgi:cyclopropane fatty-acyl-phospholipid synthase-like methyltransferase